MGNNRGVKCCIQQRTHTRSQDLYSIAEIMKYVPCILPLKSKFEDATGEFLPCSWALVFMLGTFPNQDIFLTMLCSLLHGSFNFFFKLQENLGSNTTKTKKHFPPFNKAPHKHLLHQHCIAALLDTMAASAGSCSTFSWLTQILRWNYQKKKVRDFLWGSNLRKAIKKWKQRRWAKFNGRQSVILKVIANLLFARDRRSQTATASLLISLPTSRAAHWIFVSCELLSNS